MLAQVIQLLRLEKTLKIKSSLKEEAQNQRDETYMKVKMPL